MISASVGGVRRTKSGADPGIEQQPALLGGMLGRQPLEQHPGRLEPRSCP